jgi:hypothetical protein
MPDRQRAEDPKTLEKTIDAIFDGRRDSQSHRVSPLMTNPGSMGKMKPVYRDGVPINEDDEGRP